MERSAVITIDGKEENLVMTTGATKQITKRYGGLDKLGDKLLKAENFEMALDEIIWLITLLANQGRMIKNLRNPNETMELLTEPMVELLTSPVDLAGFKDSILEAMYKGTQRNVESEPSKNGVVDREVRSVMKNRLPDSFIAGLST